MSIHALSSGTCNAHAAPRAEAVRRHHHHDHGDRAEARRGCGDDEARTPRRHGGMAALFDALGDELRALARPAPAEAPPAAPAPAKATDCRCDDTAAEPSAPEAAGPAKPDLREALKDFAEALFDGLREIATDSRHGGCHPGRGHGWGRGGVGGNLAERIEALASRLAAEAKPPLATATDAKPAVPTSTPAPAPVAATPSTAVPIAADPLVAEPPAVVTEAAPATPPAAVAPSALESSFATLWKALDPARLEESGGLADLLAFLRRLSDRLDGDDRPRRDGMGQLLDTVA